MPLSSTVESPVVPESTPPSIPESEGPVSGGPASGVGGQTIGDFGAMRRNVPPNAAT